VHTVQFFRFPVFQTPPRPELPKSCRRPITPPSPRARLGGHPASGTNYPTLCPSLPRSGPFSAQACRCLRRPPPPRRSDRGASSVESRSPEGNNSLSPFGYSVKNALNFEQHAREGSGLFQSEGPSSSANKITVKILKLSGRKTKCVCYC
jgi:hypothetical protein